MFECFVLLSTCVLDSRNYENKKDWREKKLCNQKYCQAGVKN